MSSLPSKRPYVVPPLPVDIEIRCDGLPHWFDAVIMLTWSNWTTEPHSPRYHFATRFARTQPVLFVQQLAPSDTPLRVESSGFPDIDLVQTTSDFGQKQVEEILALLRSRGIKRPLLWIYNSLHYQPLIDALPNAFRVYHATEDYLTPAHGWELNQTIVAESVVALLAQIDLLVGASDALIRSCQRQGRYRGAAVLAANDHSFDFRFSEICTRIAQKLERMQSQSRKLNVAIFYDERSTHIGTVYEYLNAFRTYSHHQVYFIPATINGWGASGRSDETNDVSFHTDLSLFDVVIVHYAVRLSLPDFINMHLAQKLTSFDGLKMLFIQDEHDTTETARRWMEKLRFDVVYTCVPEEGREFVYPKRRFPATEFLPTLTGYVPEDPHIDNYAMPLEQRDVVIGYRGRILAYFYGALGYEKYEIGIEVKRLAEERGIPVDIEVDDNKRIYGPDWYRFLGSVRATMGTESGSNVFDFDGKLREAVTQALAENPNRTFHDIHQELLAEHEGIVKMNQISPKIFEAIRLRTALVLFEGTYSGVVKPDLHYIPLKKDFSNIDEVFGKLEDLDYLRQLTDRAYQDIIETGKYTYRRFIEGIDADIAARTLRNARYELFASPVAARSADGAVKAIAPLKGIGHCLSTAIMGGAFQREQMTNLVEHHAFPTLFSPPEEPLVMTVVESPPPEEPPVVTIVQSLPATPTLRQIARALFPRSYATARSIYHQIKHVRAQTLRQIARALFPRSYATARSIYHRIKHVRPQMPRAVQNRAHLMGERMVRSNLSEEKLNEIAFSYERDGYALIRSALSEEEMAPILAQWQHVRDPLRAGKAIDGIKRDNFYIHGKLPSPLGDVVEHPVITGIVKKLLGPDVALYINRLNVKDQAFTDLIHLHQDIPYFNGGVNKINFFIALQDINLNNGAMVYVPGSHHLGILDRNTIDISKHPELQVVVPSLRPGDLVIADIRLWHSSVPNTQVTDRVLLQMMFQPADDGSYYPLSVPEPRLIAGKWRTNEFKPWKIITADTGSQLSVTDTAEMGASTTNTAAIAAVLASEPPAATSNIRIAPTRSTFADKCKTALPAWAKQRIRYVFLSTKKPSNANRQRGE